MHNKIFYRFPGDSLWNYYVNPKLRAWEKWEKIKENFVFDSRLTYYDMQVPTLDTTKYGYFSKMSKILHDININYNINFTVMFPNCSLKENIRLCIRATQVLVKVY